MINETIISFSEALFGIDDKSATAWIYLPSNKHWDLDSNCGVLESEEVPPKLEDDQKAGIPEFAKQNDLVRVLPVTVTQEIVTNARTQKPNATANDYLSAFIYYYKHDAFIKLIP